MKKPAAKTKPTAERKQGKPPGGTGVNKPVTEEKVPSKKPGTRYSRPSQTQKM
jgi:hypothetical protein